MNKRAIVFVVGVVGVAATVVWAFRPPSTLVDDVARPQTITLGKVTDSGFVHAIWVEGSGYIHGEATITLLLGDEPYKTEKLKGPVDFKWGGDWYSETAQVRYEPMNVASGRVVLRYRFYR